MVLLNEESNDWKPKGIIKMVKRQHKQGEKTLVIPIYEKDVLCKTYKEFLQFSNRKEQWANGMV